MCAGNKWGADGGGRDGGVGSLLEASGRRARLFRSVVSVEEGGEGGVGGCYTNCALPSHGLIELLSVSSLF